ncbi:ABC-2 type transport system ATP-binding protein [Enterococcus sp. AZ194]|uniref:ABC transporter ATP-binding protein n=1 Tax=Enterococcus sp. AZ194 TaxID=2774629 RepID=UPI003F228E87
MIVLQNAIEVKQLSKVYRSGFRALDELTITVKKGEIFSLLGKNGAGKSTLINILTTYLSFTSGDVRILGCRLPDDIRVIRGKLSSVAQKNSIDGYLTLIENMTFQGSLYHVAGNELQERIDELIQTLDLEAYRDKKVSECSGGVQRRLDIAMSMISVPEILFLDEPTTGMDIESRLAMWELIKKINQVYGTTIFLTTHYLEEADQLSDRVCIIKDGHEQMIGTSNELKHYLQQNLIRFSFENWTESEKKSMTEFLRVIDFVKEVRVTDNAVTIEVNDIRKNYFELLKIGIREEYSFYRAEIVRPTLDDVFLAIASKEVTHERDQ